MRSPSHVTLQSAAYRVSPHDRLAHRRARTAPRSTTWCGAVSRAAALPCRGAARRRRRASLRLRARAGTALRRRAHSRRRRQDQRQRVPGRARRSARSRRWPRSRRTATATSTPRPTALVAAAAKLEGLEPAHFAVYPGSSLALHHAVIALHVAEARARSSPSPATRPRRSAAEFIGAKVVRVPLRPDGAHDLPAMLAGGEEAARPASSTSAIRTTRRER